MTQNPDNRWAAYYAAGSGRAPRPLLVDAMARFAANSPDALPRLAVDLGCGDGTETQALLQQGWRVLAIDQEPAALQLVEAKVQGETRTRLETRVASFENLLLPAADLIYAGYSLPFCAPAHFTSLWQTIVTALPPDGCFAGQFFGPHDSWAKNPNLTILAAEQVQQLCQAFEIESWQEVDEDGDSFRGPKHWHIFHVIARKI